MSLYDIVQDVIYNFLFVYQQYMQYFILEFGFVWCGGVYGLFCFYSFSGVCDNEKIFLFSFDDEFQVWVVVVEVLVLQLWLGCVLFLVILLGQEVVGIVFMLLFIYWIRNIYMLFLEELGIVRFVYGFLGIFIYGLVCIVWVRVEDIGSKVYVFVVYFVLGVCWDQLCLGFSVCVWISGCSFLVFFFCEIFRLRLVSCGLYIYCVIFCLSWVFFVCIFFCLFLFSVRFILFWVGVGMWVFCGFFFLIFLVCCKDQSQILGGIGFIQKGYLGVFGYYFC